MKKITSATGSSIRFLLRGDAPFMFDPTEGIIMSDIDASICQERLGMQLSIEDITPNQATTMIDENKATATDTAGVEPAPGAAVGGGVASADAAASADAGATADAAASADATAAAASTDAAATGSTAGADASAAV